jgi:hypothetical protein
MALSTININTNPYNNILLIFSLNELMREIKTLLLAMKETCSVIADEHAPILSIQYQVVISCEDIRFGFGPLLICI